jgi:ribosomal protein L1
MERNIIAAAKIEPSCKHNIDEAVAKVKEIAFAKFDETVELTVWLSSIRERLINLSEAHSAPTVQQVKICW